MVELSAPSPSRDCDATFTTPVLENSVTAAPPSSPLAPSKVLVQSPDTAVMSIAVPAEAFAALVASLKLLSSILIM